MGRPVYLLDACVLIDIDAAGGPGFLSNGSTLGAIRVADVILAEETIGVSRTRCGKLNVGIVEIEPALAQVAGIGLPDGISYHDHLSYLLARRQGWTLVTNDKRLRALCAGEDVAYMWGLDLVVALVAAGALSARDAKRFGRELLVTNTHFTKLLIERFEQDIDDADDGG